MQGWGKYFRKKQILKCERVEDSGAWGSIGNEKVSGLNNHLYLPLNTYNLYQSWMILFITELWLYTGKCGKVFLIIFNLDTQSDNPKKLLKFSACKFLPSAKYLGMFREELIGSKEKKGKRKKKRVAVPQWIIYSCFLFNKGNVECFWQ